MNRPLTDEKIRKIIIQERKEAKRKRMRKRVIRRCTLLVFVLILIILSIFFVSGKLKAKIEESKEPIGIIFIDPGHGGVDSGTDANNRFEKDDTLKLALGIKKELEAKNYTVYMSRTEDVDVDREERGKMANDKKADLFISLHRNQASEGNGAEIYIPSDSTEVHHSLADSLMKAFIECGFQERSITEGVYKDSDDDYYENSVPTMPCCLCEIGFTSSNKDNKIYDKIDENSPIIADAIINAHKKIYPEKYDE